MPFVIDFEGSDAAATTAPTAREAFDLARELVAQGRTRVTITSPSGDTHTLSELASLLRVDAGQH